MGGGGAFTDSCVESLSLPETIQSIDDGALKGVPSLKHVQISPKCEGFSSLDGMLFTKDYSHLLLIPEGKEGAIAIPGSTKFIPAQALSLCRSGTSLSSGDGSTAFASYDRMLFSKDMKTLVACPPAYGKAVVLPAETEAIGEYALAGCKDLASITALGNVQSIDPTAFADEVKASAVVALAAGEDYEARKAVWEAAGFRYFAEPATPGATTNPDNNETSGLAYTLLDDYTLSVSWQGKDDPQVELEIPASAEISGVPYRVSTITENAFANRGSLTSVKLPATITTINNGAFAGCANLSTIEFPNTLRIIGERAFEATSLKDIWLPVSINSIGSRAFASCPILGRVVALSTPGVATDTLAGCTNVSIYIPSGTEDSWNPGLPSNNNHLMPYGVSLSEDPLAIEAGQVANLLEGGDLQAPDPIEASYSYAAAPLSVDAGTVSAKKAGTSDVTAVLTLDNVELTRASRTVEVSPNPDAETNIVQLNSEVALPAAYLADARTNQISVVAPFAVTFGQDAPYDVADPPTSMESTAKFINNTTVPMQLASVSCAPRDIAFTLIPKDSCPSLDRQSLFSLYPEGNAGSEISFGYGSENSTVTSITDPGAFVIPSKSESHYIFRLNLEHAQIATGVVADNGITTRDLVSVICTFDKSAESFFLKDNNTGSVYNLAQVKEHAEDIAANKENSAYWIQYQSYLKNDASYTCQTVWNETAYDVRIIGINHDELSNPTVDGPQTAGLTFQFKNLLNGIYPMNSETSINSGGWGASELRARMNPGINNNTIWKLVPEDLQNSIEFVKKKYQPTYDSDIFTIETSDDKLFIASYSELVESSYWGSTHWTAQEGTQYAYWNGKVTNNADNNACLAKDTTWWTRSVNPSSSMYFLLVDRGGYPGGSIGASAAYDVCPCFCL